MKTQYLTQLTYTNKNDNFKNKNTCYFRFEIDGNFSLAEYKIKKYLEKEYQHLKIEKILVTEINNIELVVL